MATSMYDSSADTERVGFQEPGRDQQHLRYGCSDIDEWGKIAVGVHAAFEYFEEVADCDLLCCLCCCVSRLTPALIEAKIKMKNIRD